MKINESISISQRPEKIWNFWMPVTTDAQWRNGITKAEWTSKPPYGIGSTGVHYTKDLGPMSWEIIKWEDGHYFEFVHTEGRLKGSIASYHVESENGSSHVSICANMAGPFIMRIIMVFMKDKMIKGIKADLRKLKELMEK
jgi:hypothetical protein